MPDQKNPLSIDEDFYIPTKEQKSYTPQTQEEIDADVQYFRKCLFEALKIPKEYLNSGSQDR